MIISARSYDDKGELWIKVLTIGEILAILTLVSIIKWGKMLEFGFIHLNLMEYEK